ncbi:MAG: ATP-binding protein [Pyrinomonadaceae bacterium]
MEQLSFPTGQDAPQVDFSTLDLLPYGIIVVDEKGVILYYNAREEQIAGRRRADVLGRNFFTEVAPCAQAQEFYSRFQETMRREGRVEDFPFRFPFPDQPREVEITLTSFEKDDARLCLISVSDITEKASVRDHLIRSERLREVGEVAASVAHNFNNLLTVIRGNAEIIFDHLPEGDPLRQRAEKILKASDDGAEMIKRIGDSTRHRARPSAPRAPVDLNEIVKDSIAFTEDYAKASQDERDARVRFETELAENVPPVRANPGALREVFVNLLRNGVDAIEGQGRITVRTRAEGEHNVVEVSDTGQGMGHDVQEKLFRPFFSTKGERGTGLGLATAYATVRRHGGEIEAASAPGEGTTFTVRLPVGDSP